MQFPELIVMLTYNDRTVEQAFQIFDENKDSSATCWGFKEEPLPPKAMKELAAYMKACGKTTYLEVVAYTQSECEAGARAAIDCGVDYLMGTIYSDTINDMCRDAGIRYMPFVGRVSQRPSILEGTVEEMVDEARRYAEKGVYGIDLLGYRYTGNAPQLNSAFTKAMDELGIPVCLAGSINSFARLDEVRQANPRTFTIGSAFFDHAFGPSFGQQIETVRAYMRKEETP